jgi:hypothetical protein
MHGGQSCCCFHQAATALSFSCNSVWSAPPLARWGNSVLNTALCPTRLDLEFTAFPALGSWPVTPKCSQCLCFSQSVLGASSSFRRLACHSMPALSLCASPDLCWVLMNPLGGWLVAPPPLSAFVALPVHSLRVCHWKVGSLFSRADSTFHPYLHYCCYITVCCLCFLVLLGGVQSAQVLCWITFSDRGWEVIRSVRCSPVHSVESCK